MKPTLLVIILGMTMAASQGEAAEMVLDVEGECSAISKSDLSGCRCRGLYFENRFGSEEGAAALHLVGRSYVPEPQVAATTLYERFGADRLVRVAQRILETRDEVIAYCPFSAHVAD